MRQPCFFLATVTLSLLGSAASACTLCENGDEIAILYAQMNTAGMTDEQITAARAKVYEAYFARKMEEARAKFTSRFHVADTAASVGGSQIAAR